jgi:asparaginyl-tRNA synthetase
MTDIKRLANRIEGATTGVKSKLPTYSPQSHAIQIAEEPYYRDLVLLRDYIKQVCSIFMSEEMNAKNVDLFMLTTSVSSPMGPGSDSEPLPLSFGDNKAFLTDSSQFGFEPVVMNGIDKVYCYLPSLRGEEPDSRHLNQFYHCEMEMAGALPEMINVVEKYVKFLASSILKTPKLLSSLSRDIDATLEALNMMADSNEFKKFTFDEACDLLINEGYKQFINDTEYGRDITSEGEKRLCKVLNAQTPFWITHFDRDRVPFYQKPDPENSDKVLCADLIFPELIEGSFGGEIVGAGQRQDNIDEMNESLQRQAINSESYEWYIKLRNNKSYRTTSGFGLGIERFISWMLCLENIREAILYPREKGVKSEP